MRWKLRKLIDELVSQRVKKMFGAKNTKESSALYKQIDQELETPTKAGRPRK